ncbi:hypothetical protein GCM10022223_61260 [Kineosporia mesophila]|uniref:Suppressor of fused protein SUFU n=1 Tax=Kineosporia mesophila TaxID=566012 RepID=A0ABP7AKG9_9ACTN|nr:hypothetical protein [Kineosporia mesophila]MCD5354060.1 hypothetical protein [Kineosporia mesophila]
MPLTPSPKRTAASWITGSDEDWPQIADFGPSGLSVHARLLFLPDPEGPWQSEAEAPALPGALSENDRLRLALQVLSRHTTTPELAYFCLWDGWGIPIPEAASLVRVPHRTYHLFEGALTDLGGWGAPSDEDPPLPAFIWPADRTWCIAKDVDQHWAGIGASEGALEDLRAIPDLNIVKADPAQPQPFYV